MGASAAIASAVVAAAGTTASMVSQNQQTQHAKGAAQAQQTVANAQAAQAAKIGPTQVTTPTDSGQMQAQANAKRLAAMRAGILSTVGAGGMGGGTAPAAKPAQPMAYASGTKTYLGQ